MKTIGLLGGMSWESTALYYRYVNEAVRSRLGGLHSARVVMVSVDFHEIDALQRSGGWSEAGRVLGRYARQVEAAGAELLVLCTNTMHMVASQIEKAIGIPMLHIADAAAAAIKRAAIHTVGLLGTRFTMEQEFYSRRLEEKHDLAVVVPAADDRELVHRIIYEELVVGVVKDESRREFLRVIEDLTSRGAQGVVLGCTEIPILVQQQHARVPLFDTTRIHAERSVELALKDNRGDGV
jgi:aspartate racemase